MKLKACCLTIAVLLSACVTTPQYTSGADYLSRYTEPAHTAIQSNSSLDGTIRDIAAVEPNLQFPARIGLARIHNRNLISVPADEAESWRTAAETLGSEFGQFIPVSPLIAEMVSPASASHKRSVVEHIRKGAARQHLDYVITYEVTDRSVSEGNALRLADLTILGLFILPSRNLKAEASASAVMLDVRNGYPYLTGSTFADEQSLSTVVGKGDRKTRLKSAARQTAVSNIAREFADGIRDLKFVSDGIKMAENKSRQSDASK